MRLGRGAKGRTNKSSISDLFWCISIFAVTAAADAAERKKAKAKVLICPNYTQKLYQKWISTVRVRCLKLRNREKFLNQHKVS